MFKAKLIGKLWINIKTLNTKAVVPLKYLSNFWRSLDLPLISCEIELDLSLSKDCITYQISNTKRLPVTTNLRAPTELETLITSATFQINKTKIYSPVVTCSHMSIKDNKWSKDSIEQFLQIDIDHMIGPTFRKINFMFFLSRLAEITLQEFLAISVTCYS